MVTATVAGPLIDSSPVVSASHVADNCTHHNDNQGSDDHDESLTSESTSTASTDLQDPSRDEMAVGPNGQNTPPPETGSSGDVGLSLSHSPSPIGDDVVKESNYFGDEQLGINREQDLDVVDSGETPKRNSSRCNSSPGTAENTLAAEATAKNFGTVENVPFAFPAAATLPLLPRSLAVNNCNNNGFGINSFDGAVKMQPANNAPELSTHPKTNQESQSTSNYNGDTSQSSSPPSNVLEARILQLEQSLNILTQFCQTMMIQQQQSHQNRFAQQQVRSMKGSKNGKERNVMEIKETEFRDLISDVVRQELLCFGSDFAILQKRVEKSRDKVRSISRTALERDLGSWAFISCRNDVFYFVYINI